MPSPGAMLNAGEQSNEQAPGVLQWLRSDKIDLEYWTAIYHRHSLSKPIPQQFKLPRCRIAAGDVAVDQRRQFVAISVAAEQRLHQSVDKRWRASGVVGAACRRQRQCELIAYAHAKQGHIAVPRQPTRYAKKFGWVRLRISPKSIKTAEIWWQRSAANAVDSASCPPPYLGN